MRSRAVHGKRQSTKSRLSFPTMEKKRAYYRTLWLSHYRKITITQRVFKTPKRHHKRQGRWLVTMPFGSIREISFDLKKYKRRQQLARPAFGGLATSLLIIAVGLGSFAFFLSESNKEVVAEVYIPTVTIERATVGLNALEESLSPYLDASVPVQIVADRIGLDAEIITVGKLSDNTMDTPPHDVDVAGWYELGPTPGELGPAIINGHIDTYRGPSVFWDLHRLKPGDEVDVTREDGTTVSFIVTEVTQFNQNNFPTDKVYGNIDHAGLRLITCGGSFNYTTKTYSHNTVVFAEMIEQ